MNLRENYEAPAVFVVELSVEGVVCQSAVMNVSFEEENW